MTAFPMPSLSRRPGQCPPARRVAFSLRPSLRALGRAYGRFAMLDLHR
jgi:hypothetical protein